MFVYKSATNITILQFETVTSNPICNYRFLGSAKMDENLRCGGIVDNYGPVLLRDISISLSSRGISTDIGC
nr:hypothetical protein HmN_000593600 [Hymenolepis microstoma]